MSWEAINLASSEFDRPADPPTTCGLIYTGKRHSLSGPPEAAKTLCALIPGLETILAEVRAGITADFALIDLEMGEHATRRLLTDLGATHDELERVYYVAPDVPPTRADLHNLPHNGVTLAIIDAAAGAYDVSGLDDNKRADAEKFSQCWITPLWEAGVTTITLDHVVKNAESRGRYAIGSERKLGQVDVALGFHPIKQLHRGASGLIRIDTHKDRPGHLPRPHAAELELHSDPHTHQITWEFRNPAESTGNAEDGWRPTVLMDRVLEYLSRNPEPISRSALASKVRGRREWVLEAIDSSSPTSASEQRDANSFPSGTFPTLGTTLNGSTKRMGTFRERLGTSVPAPIRGGRERISGTTPTRPS